MTTRKFKMEITPDNELISSKIKWLLQCHRCIAWKLGDDGIYRCWCGCPAPEEG